MSIELEDYFLLIKSWELKYGKSRLRRFNLTETRLCCAKCGRLKKKMSRHHIRNDLFFARMLPSIYAARYIQFLKEDVAKLCDTDHKLVHHVYKPITARLWIELNQGGIKIITKEWCDKWMLEYQKKFEQWIKLPKKGKKRRRKRSNLTTKPEV